MNEYLILSWITFGMVSFFGVIFCHTLDKWSDKYEKKDTKTKIKRA